MTRAGRRTPRRAAAAATAIAALVGAVALLTGVLSAPETASVAARFQIRNPQPPADVVVVAIDDLTFGDLNTRWPFPRSFHARAIDRLHAAGARAIVYDVQFTEPTTPRQDEALYRSIQRAGGAVLATSESDARGHTNVFGGDANLAAIGAQAGASNLTNEAGGSITRFPYAVSGLKSLAIVTGARVGGRPVPRSGFDRSGAWIDYRGGPGTIPSISFSSVVRGQFDPAAVRGKVVVVGAAAPTLQDMHATPAGSQLMSGPEVQANAIWTVLHGVPLRSAPLGLDLLLVAFLALLPLALRLRLGLIAAAIGSVMAGLAYLVAAQFAFDAGTVVAVSAPIVALAVATVGMVVTSHLAESRERRRVARDNDVLEQRVRERTEALEMTQLEVVRRLAVAVESRDAETGHHIDRIGSLCEQLALATGIDAAGAGMLRNAAALHDVGKIAIPDRVLLKPGPLDPGEWELMKTHTTEGARILAGSESALVRLGETIALTHHERWDGSGYPAGLAGDEIPLAGRICAVCDSYDAMTSTRPYKDAMNPGQALAEIERHSGSQFDPRLVEVFCAMRRDLTGDVVPPEWALAPPRAVRPKL